MAAWASTSAAFDGVTANDSNDSDTGPNKLQNFPDLSNAIARQGRRNLRHRFADQQHRRDVPHRVLQGFAL